MADTKQSGYSAASSFLLPDEWAINEAGSTKKVTGAQLKTALGPTVPVLVNVSAEFTGTGVPTATLPTGHAANDILVLVLQTSNDSLVVAPAGYQQLGPQNGMNAGAAALANRLCIFWKRDGGSESAPTIPDSGDHTYGFMFAIRGCPTAGDPFHFGGNNFKFTTSTSGSGPKSVTFLDNCLVVDIFAGNADNASAEGSSGANSDLSSFTEQFDDGTTDGTGGFLWMSTGIKAVAGDIGPTTVTWANSSSDLCSRIHFIASDAIRYQAASRGAEIQIFIGSAQDLDDLWVKPSGARRVMAQAIAGGGGGSSGRNAATAAGGGGGGGGHITPERWFNASDLAATVSLHCGKGGAATAASDGAAGNAGTNSLFGKGLTPVYMTAIAGTGGIAAITADGGNGGNGGGYPVPAVVTTRVPRGTTFAGTGEIGGSGGSGTTAPVGGSDAMWGGGGGESGADTDTSVAANGDSLYGGGGGGGGRAAGTLSVPGIGGGAGATAATRGTNGTQSTNLPYGGSGGAGGDSTTGTGGAGGFPGGGGGGGGTASGTQAGGRGGHGCIVVVTYF